MKKNIAARLGVLALTLTLVTSSLVSGTYSKYTIATTGTDTARVAKFAFNLTSLNGKSGSVASTAITQSTTTGTYDIFSYTDAGVYGNGLNGSTKIIAPGTTGSLAITVSNLSEVAVVPTFSIDETNGGSIPVYYTIGSNTQRYSKILTGSYPTSATYKTMTNLSTDVAAAFTELAASNGTVATTGSVTLHWYWDFASAGTAQTDSNDTTLGIAGTATDLLTIQTTVTQSDT